MRQFHHRKLPNHSALLSGQAPPDGYSFQSDHLQIWYNNTEKSWTGDGEVPHKHMHSDECFIVLRGTLVVEVNSERFSIEPGEICFFPAGLYHSIVEIYPPVETLMIRAPSVSDKMYHARDGSVEV